jgi:selenide,water dikinase
MAPDPVRGAPRRLVLVGAGLANLHVLRSWCRRPVAGVELTVVSPEASVYYSGMVPGLLHGAYEPDALRIDLAAITRDAGARLVVEPAQRLDSAAHELTAGGERIAYDVCSVDVGSGLGAAGVPGVAEHAFSLRPMSGALALRAHLDGLAASSRPFSVVVVGAGPAGVEMAMAIHRRLAAAQVRATVTLTDAARALLPAAPAVLREQVAALFTSRGIATALGARATEVRSGSVWLSSGAVLPSDVTVWVTGSAASPFLAATDLARDADGYLRVDRSLRVTGTPDVYAAGDCATLDGGPPLPHSGVTAVRQGPVLLRNLRAALGAGRPARFHPQARALALLDTADGRAIALWGGVHTHSRWAWWLKRGIDRRFVGARHARCDETPVPRS